MTDMPAIDAERAVAELTALATNLGVSDAAFQTILDEVMTRAQASPDWGRPHEVAAEVRRQLLAAATAP
ncbi:hypothetical protein Maq22A_3p50400 (plasmid) [Methylobacterium aquaticum]|uniref:Uncharacterized protein n=1 Tax=Methylobacterium aquaticum TaxID=270351 RepID=A0A0C6G2I5_9HYPH|nr:hypothetical protein Maq22A_3p50400 [Methylobacterium aquaticum]